MGCKAVIEMIGGKLYQWDTGRKVRITMRDESVIEVHFAHDNDENALVVRPVSARNGVCEASIPNILLQSAILRYQFKMELITASDVWGFVPRYLTEAQATRICGPRPS